ncbi:uncharacterized protein E0L32_006010 [Thyridium curvatum]|uniref:FAD-binding domain-containing protein n=1 Tax=Thyridium curvatum TaxID=1093900 RepID=A0A507B809_9PEZI|nr:uncharacterized protein E0L32_006010 [Thyridium curvatum]TPX13539.1 hypothetical protein E0L32_006010 [Thyridium curvatum]
MAERPKALIVGAGIAGLAAAWWLDKAGWSSVIIEKAPGIRDGGYIVSLSGPCRDTVERMDLGPRLSEVSYKFDENVLSDVHGRRLLRLRYKDVHGGVDSLALCRGDLARALLDALPTSVDIRFDETLEDAVLRDDKVTATLKSGTVIEADLLIGADGIRSFTRDRFWKEADCLEHLGYMYGVYDVEGNTELGSDCVSFNSPGHLDVLYRLRNDRLAALHIWRDDGVKLHDRQGKPRVIRDATAGRNITLIKDVLDRAEKTGYTPLIDSLTMVDLQSWSQGRVVLLGDAAHCLTLMSGQGAGMALVSAEILGKELMRTSDVAEALASHERKLRPVIERLQDRSRRMAAMYIPKSTFSYYLRNLLLKIMPYSWIVSWHVNSTKSEIELMQS